MAGTKVTIMMNATGTNSFPIMYSSLPTGREKYNRNARVRMSFATNAGAIEPIMNRINTVSYTHLTLPTILLV